MKTRIAAASFFALTTSWVGAAHADDTSLEGLLSEEVVTTVSKSAETSENAPALVRSISADEIRRYGMTSVDEALDFLGVGIHAEQSPGHAQLTVRGVAFAGDRGNHTLLLVDGHIINEPLYGQASFDQTLGIPLELIDHIELVLGPGSAIYGSNAVLAVVNVVTKSASTNGGLHAVVEGGAIGTVRSTVTAGRSFDLLGKRAGFTAGLTYFGRNVATDLPKQDLGPNPRGGPDYAWGGVTRSSDRAAIPALQLRLVRDRLDVAARFVVASTGDPIVGGDFDHPHTGWVDRRASLSASQSFALGRLIEVTATAYGDAFASTHRIIISNPSTCPIASGCDYRERASSSRLGAELRAEADWLHDGRIVTALGVNGSLDHVSASTAITNEASGASVQVSKTVDVSHVLNLAANGQQTLRPFKWLDLNAGARVDWRQIQDADGTTETVNPVVTPRLAATVRPWRGASAKLIYAEALRAPNPFEVDAQSATQLHAAALQPEHTSSVEAILEQRVDAQRFTVGAFRTVYRGLINPALLTLAETQNAIAGGATYVFLSPNVPVLQYRDGERIEGRGLDAAFNGSAVGGRLGFGGSITGALTHSADGDQIPIAPQVFGNARVSYDLGPRLPTAALAASFAGTTVSDRNFDSGFVNGTRAPSALELRATLTGDVPHVKGLSYRLIVAHQVSDRTPLAVGPIVRGEPGFTAPSLSPTQRWNAILGFQYDFGR